VSFVATLKKKWGFSKTVATLPAGMRIYAIGDIHGRADLLEDLLTQISRDAANGTVDDMRLIFLGDYVDRGWESRAVLERLTTLSLPPLKTVFLMGNHEEAFLNFLADPQFLDNWRQYGGLETLHSYGLKDLTFRAETSYLQQVHAEFQNALPAAHLTFLKALPLSYEAGDYFFAHAGVRPGIPLAEQSPRDLCWIREEFLTSKVDFGKRIVHGHCPEEEPQVRENRIGIDTGAYITGRLTAVVLEGTDVRFLQTG
tara:strand:+ start:345 stop:1112 length:768 start_codon:yes stop_codon:yes gene_type:complete